MSEPSKCQRLRSGQWPRTCKSCGATVRSFDAPCPEGREIINVRFHAAPDRSQLTDNGVAAKPG